MNNSEKTTMHYRVVSAYNPKTGGTLLRPVVTNRTTLTLSQIVAYAKTAGFVRGQQKDLEGLLGGFIEAMKDRSLAGYSINVNNWYIISGRLKGTVDDTRLLTELNDYHVTITATADLKAAMSDFNWQRVDEGVVIKVENITSPGGDKGEVVRSMAIVANGKNLSYDAAWGDSVTVSYEGLATPIALTPVEQSTLYLRFDWPAALDMVPAGTVLTFTFKLHGAEGAAEQPNTLFATLVGPEPAPSLTTVQQGDRAAGTAGFGQGASAAITISGNIPGGKQTGDTLRLDCLNEGAVYATMNATSYITASTGTTLTLGNGLDNDSAKPDGDWQNKTAKFTLVRDGNEYPVTFTFVNA